MTEPVMCITKLDELSNYKYKIELFKNKEQTKENLLHTIEFDILDLGIEKRDVKKKYETTYYEILNSKINEMKEWYKEFITYPPVYPPPLSV